QRRSLLLLFFAMAAAACRSREMKPVEKDKTRSAAAWLREEPVALLHQYIRIDTSEKQGEQEGAQFLQRFLDCEGIETEIVCPAPRRCNLLARLPGRRREGAL